MGKKGGKKRRRIWIPTLSIAVVILLFIIYVFPSVTGVLETTSTIEYGSLQVVDSVDVYFVRDETVYYASRAGQLHYNVNEGDVVRKGTKVLQIKGGADDGSDGNWNGILNRVAGYNMGASLFSDDMKRVDDELTDLAGMLKSEKEKRLPDQNTIANLQDEMDKLQVKKEHILSAGGTVSAELDAQSMPIGSYGLTPSSYNSPYNGLISYYIDGYETEFSPANMRLLSGEKVKKLDLSHSEQNVKRKYTRINEPLYKSVKNNNWYALFWVNQSDISKYRKNADITLRLPKGDVKGSVFDIVADGNEYMIILQFDRYYQDLCQLRKVHADVVSSDYRGLKVLNSSITTRDGQAGVFIKDISGDYVFKPVKIIASDGEYSLLESSTFQKDTSDGAISVNTVEPYDEILNSGKPDSGLRPSREKNSNKDKAADKNKKTDQSSGKEKGAAPSKSSDKEKAAAPGKSSDKEKAAAPDQSSDKGKG